MKGQFFLISAVVVIVVFFLIKSSLNLAQIIENNRYLEIGLDGKEFANVRNELMKTVELSYKRNETANVERYIVYVRQRLKSRVVDLNGIAVESSFSDVVPGSSTGLNVTVMNFLGTDIQSLNLTFSYDGSSQVFSGIADNSSVGKDFNFITSSDVNYTLSVNYKASTESKQYNIQIPVEIGSSRFIGFFDLRMKSLRSENRDELSKVVETV